MERKSIIGLLGSGLLFAGVFMPIVSAPIVGSINYFHNGQGDGTVLLLLAGVSCVLTLAKKHKWLLLTGMLSTGLLCYTLFHFYNTISDTKSKINRELGSNPFKGLADAAIGSVQIQWGWAVMLLGAVLLMVAALVSSDDISDSTNGSDDEKDEDRQSCLFCAEAIKIEATVCRFCGREQPADALPEVVNCPACEEELILDGKERLAKKFVCIVCGYQTGQTFTEDHVDAV